jgi:tRNA G37 N-methylase Trm5
MATEFSINEDCVWKELDKAYQKRDIRNLHALRQAMEPLYEKFIDHLIKQPNGMQFVVNMRKDLLVCIL